MVQQELSIVDTLYADFRRLIAQIDDSEISLRNSAEEIFRKNLLMAAASYFERRITDYILEFFNKSSTDNRLITEFVRNQALERKYHTLFDWNARNANKFFGLFGMGFKGHMNDYVRNNTDYQVAIRAFLEIGRERNRIIHEDFGAVSLEKTTEEIYDLYKNALVFAEQIPLHFEGFIESRQNPSTEHEMR